MTPELMEMVAKGGVIVLLCWMLYQSETRTARAEARADKERALNEALTRESIASSVKTEATLGTLASILTGRKAES